MDMALIQPLSALPAAQSPQMALEEENRGGMYVDYSNEEIYDICDKLAELDDESSAGDTDDSAFSEESEEISDEELRDEFRTVAIPEVGFDIYSLAESEEILRMRDEEDAAAHAMPGADGRIEDHLHDGNEPQ
eukprot:GFYU01001384.1.p1 GENE.GFYU01001384.1~~GFYU01001384.1.p1  ORF type:complete len:133 (-),score=47.64 GFYU01001384.1:161-559(-)